MEELLKVPPKFTLRSALNERPLNVQNHFKNTLTSVKTLKLRFKLYKLFEKNLTKNFFFCIQNKKIIEEMNILQFLCGCPLRGHFLLHKYTICQIITKRRKIMRETLKQSKRIVVKVGTSTLTYENGRLNLKCIERMAWVLSDLVNQGKEVVLVTSGAIGVGAARLAFSERPKEMKKKQAAAAVGQAVLIQIYQNFFKEYNQAIAQILLTKEEIQNEERRNNTLNTLHTLLKLGIVPIINANDTISTYEIEFSDNDNLSAMVAEMIEADLLILLTDIDGLYDKDPRIHADAKRISYIPEVTEQIHKMAGQKGSKFSVGGMATKVQAAEICQKAGVNMVVAAGNEPTIIHKIIDGEDVGTFFEGKKK